MRYLILSFILFLVGPAGAQEKKDKTDPSSQLAVVITDNAAVYSAPSFDSMIRDYLAVDTRVRIARKPVAGEGGLGLFYKIRTPRNIIGYITDVDVNPEFKNTVTGAPKKNPTFSKEKEKEKNYQADGPIIFTRYLGLAVGQVRFAESLFGSVRSASSNMFGLKYTGPGVIWDGPPLDLDLLFFLGAPEYYKEVSNTTPTGMVMLLSILLQLPAMEGENDLLYYGAGPMVVVTKIDYRVGSKVMDATEARPGLVGQLGYARRLSPRWLFRLETKYYIESNTQYPGVWGSLQMVY